MERRLEREEKVWNNKKDENPKLVGLTELKNYWGSRLQKVRYFLYLF